MHIRMLASCTRTLLLRLSWRSLSSTDAVGPSKSREDSLVVLVEVSCVSVAVTLPEFGVNWFVYVVSGSSTGKGVVWCSWEESEFIPRRLCLTGFMNVCSRYQ